MQGWQAAPGQTLLVPSGPGLHLFFLVLGPVVLADYGAAPQLAMVNASTLREDLPYDSACVLEVGEHPFVRRRSYLAYRHMRLDASQHVEKMVRSAVWTPHDACSTELLQRIVAGVCRSRLAPREYKRIFRCP
ncbi:MAG: hypothetical protein AMXMBFR78_09790 [Rubrivivax sp.]|jgi:hypothetical protein